MKQSPKVVPSDIVGEGQSASQVKDLNPIWEPKFQGKPLIVTRFKNQKSQQIKSLLHLSRELPQINLSQFQLFLQWIFLERLIMIYLTPNSQRLRSCPKRE